VRAVGEPERVADILRQWMAQHIAGEHEERLKYQRGPAIHQARAEAHALAAVALYQALEEEGDRP
jgi:hypothetical protein